jgi:hypothetical protein
MSDKVRVTFANTYTDRASGTVYDQGKTYEVAPALGRLVKSLGKARPATADEKVTSRAKAADTVKEG